MKVYFVASIYNLKVDRVLNRGISVIEGIRLSNSKARLDTFIDEYFKKLAGTLEVDELYDKPFVYYEGTINEEIDVDNGDERLNLLDYYLRLTQIFSNFLWLAKDNSVTVQQGFLYIKYPNGKPHSMTSNMRTPLFFNSKGEREQIVFTSEELKELASWFKTLNHENIEKETHEISLVVSTISNRIERFNYFLQSTRTQTHLPSRIGMYCTLLEILLSTDKDEITHKIAERLAKILGETYEERLEIFTFIKTAYAIRSSTFHGDKLPRKLRDTDKLKEMASKFDEYLRKLFSFILSKKNVIELYSKDNNDDLNAWFKELILK
ncbi:hypothetical protein C5137_07565 [Bacillus cereus]|uniref:HEPN domain-containing protein n=1 Tax=Bacillus cereus TaxID=1396 RepID=UPI001F5C749D|nr:HEPN domain-containing protein [Bacillus cereus]MCI3146184.1 hypothetical protein [Bacillus cereus]